RRSAQAASTAAGLPASCAVPSTRAAPSTRVHASATPQPEQPSTATQRARSRNTERAKREVVRVRADGVLEHEPEEGARRALRARLGEQHQALLAAAGAELVVVGEVRAAEPGVADVAEADVVEPV